MVDQNESPPLTVAARPDWADRLRELGLISISPLRAPDLSSNRWLFAVASLTTLSVWGLLAAHPNHFWKSLGDTDDAMRLVLVRELLSGRGWFDQWVGRLQPPIGVYLHWSRLLDGALAGAIWLFQRVLSPAQAEMTVRFAWPLLWIFPAIACALSTARNLGGRSAVFICALLCALNPSLYIQFIPGRVDHHNVQIVMALIAVACASAPTKRLELAVAAGIASGLGLAIGIEALVFHALVGASYAFRLAFDREEAPAARAYALALAGATLTFFGLQTPPWRWTLSFCDEIGLNLVAAISTAALGFAAIATWSDGLSRSLRLASLFALGVVTAGVYLALDPHCIQGPFGDVDPRLRSIWFDHIGELASWPQLWRLDRVAALQSISVTLAGLAAAIVLLSSRPRRAAAPLLLAVALLVMAGLASALAVRMESYAFWFGIPVLAAAAAQIATATLGNLLLPTVAISFLASPCLIGSALNGLATPFVGRATVAGNQLSNGCFDTGTYRPLAALPPGVVLAQVDLGSFILANTPDSALAAPYLATWGILASQKTLTGASMAGEARVRALHVAYVVECPSEPALISANSLESDLRRGRAPPWLQPLSGPHDTLQIYRVRPPTVVSPG